MIFRGVDTGVWILFFIEPDNFTIEPRVFGMSVEAGTGLGTIVVMVAMNITPIHLYQIIDQFEHSRFLRWSSRICGGSRSIEATNITNANTMSVMPIAVSTSPTNCPTTFDSAVKPDNVVISDIFPTLTIRRFLGMVSFNFSNPYVGRRLGTRAMYDDILYYSHERIMIYAVGFGVLEPKLLSL